MAFDSVSPFWGRRICYFFLPNLMEESGGRNYTMVTTSIIKAMLVGGEGKYKCSNDTGVRKMYEEGGEPYFKWFH